MEVFVREEKKDGMFCYDYPRPAVTVDVVVFRQADSGWEVLLIRRKNGPHRGLWAFPGGFVEPDETLEDAASRELQEETGLSKIELHQIGAFGEPGRDPRGRTISIAFAGVLEDSQDATGADDAEEAQWFAVNGLPKLAFDHDEIFRSAAAWKDGRDGSAARRARS